MIYDICHYGFQIMADISRGEPGAIPIIPFHTLWPGQNGRHFADNIFKCIFLNENFWILIKISLKFVPKGPINNISALVQLMAWCHPGKKSLSEPRVVSLLTHICTRPLWVNSFSPIQYHFGNYSCAFPHPIPLRKKNRFTASMFPRIMTDVENHDTNLARSSI